MVLRFSVAPASRGTRTLVPFLMNFWAGFLVKNLRNTKKCTLLAKGSLGGGG